MGGLPGDEPHPRPPVFRAADLPVRKQRTLPFQSFVRVIRSSSALSGTAAVLGPEYFEGVSGTGVSADKYAWYTTTYGPLSAFDGLRSSAWVEGVEGPGIGEWIEFELTEPVLGLEIFPGMQMIDFRGGGVLDFAGNQLPEQYYRDIFAKNYRPKRIDLILTERSLTYSLSLEDGDLRSVFEDIYLPPGRYKLYIKEVYPGTAWDDTCLGELVFTPAPQIMETPIIEHAFRSAGWIR